MSSVQNLRCAVLAGIGVYGVASYTVAQQVREIGIRMALGADRAVVAQQFLRTALASGLSGIFLGGVLSLAAARLLERFLIGVSVADPKSYLAAGGVLLLAVGAAAVLPARRAAATEPMVALRTE